MDLIPDYNKCHAKLFPVLEEILRKLAQHPGEHHRGEVRRVDREGFGAVHNV